MTHFDRWYVDKSFTSDWTSDKLQNWTRFVSRNNVRSILEIGSWEGRSAIFFLEHCLNSTITCIDTFKGGQEHLGIEGLATVEERFDSNLAPYGSRVEKIRSRSIPALDRLGIDCRMFDVLYIVGSHQRDDVILDTLLAWRLLKKDGLMMWDDYRWKRDLPERDRPETAVNTFFDLHGDELEILYLADQVIARRRSSIAGSKRLPGMTVPRNLRNLYRFAMGSPINDFRAR